MTLLGDLRRAIDDGLTLHYQPIIAIETGMVRRVEGLIGGSTGARVAPSGRVHRADRAEQPEPRGRAHGRAPGLATLGRWRSNGGDIGLSVNIGGRTLADTDLIGEIVDLVVERLPMARSASS